MTSVYVTLAVAMTMMVVASFWAIYVGPLLRGDADRPWLFHLHGAVFLGWMGLLVAQATLVSIGRTRLHRRVGTLGMAYGALVVALGLAITFVAASMHMASGAWDVDSAAAFLLLPLGDMALFAGFFGAAVAYRRRPELHKRLILLATVALLFAAVARVVPIEPHCQRLEGISAATILGDGTVALILDAGSLVRQAHSAAAVLAAASNTLHPMAASSASTIH